MTYSRDVRAWGLILVAALVAPAAVSAARADTYAVTLSGTINVVSSLQIDQVYEGGACTMPTTFAGHETITWKTTAPLQLTVAGGKGTARARVPYTNTMSGTATAGEPRGTLANGAPCEPLTLPPFDCETRTGTISLKVVVAGGKVTVTGPIGDAERASTCPGSHAAALPVMTGAFAANVKGTSSKSGDGGSFTSQFTARFARR
jgi:hypothetical protein